MAEETKYKYRVKPGREFGQGSDQYARAGDIVELTLTEAQGFCYHENPAFDTFEPVGNTPRTLQSTSLRGQVEAKPDKTDFEKEVLKESVFDMDDEAFPFDSMTIAQLKALPEWNAVPDPKPTRKADILAAIKEIAG